MAFVWLIIQVGAIIFDGWLFMVLTDRPLITLSGHGLASLLFSLSFGRSLISRFPQNKASLLGGFLAFFIPVVGMCCSFCVALLLMLKPLPAGNPGRRSDIAWNRAVIQGIGF